MPSPLPITSPPDEQLAPLLEVVRKYWGYDRLRPLQGAAMTCIRDRRDSLLVLPTGGGKSICYQAPALLEAAPTVVVSPLISLMKDQLDTLHSNGIPAVQFNSSLSPPEAREAEAALLSGQVKLAFTSPERMATGAFRHLVARAGVRTFAIDEAHCISHWGHDFRPEYRQLGELKTVFPTASIHAFTATATEPVRADILAQLGLVDATVLVGNFDRPNLTYRVVPRVDAHAQALEVIRRHPGEAGIIYCIRRKDVDELTTWLRGRGLPAIAYHAGLTPHQRKAAQDAFSSERCDLVVATVAFGMGIDRSNIRFVLHLGMPKSIEHYQQETGRAGRDGLEAECVLLVSPADALTWREIVKKSARDAENAVDPDYLKHALRHIADMEHYCRPVHCRHRALVEYFGQAYPLESCEACDVCLGDSEPVPDGQTIARKILSCIARVNQNFGINHLIGVLRGERSAAILQRGHNELSTYGLLRDHSKSQLRDWIHQLLAQGIAIQSEGDFPVLKLNPASWDVMRDTRQARLTRPANRSAAAPEAPTAEHNDTSSSNSRTRDRTPKGETISWAGVDQPLFEKLRALRKEIAAERRKPPFIIFSDTTLRELARVRPSSIDRLQHIYGIGERKQAEFGPRLLALLDAECDSRNLPRNCD